MRALLKEAHELLITRVRLARGRHSKGWDVLLPVPALLVDTLSDLHQLVTQVDILHDVVDGEHVRANAMALEPLAMHAIEVGRVEIA